MTTPKNVVFIGLELEDAYLVLGGGGDFNFWWEESTGGIFPGGGKRGGDEQIFGWLEDSPPIPLVEKTLMVGFGEIHEGFQDWTNK